MQTPKRPSPANLPSSQGSQSWRSGPQIRLTITPSSRTPLAYTCYRSYRQPEYPALFNPRPGATTSPLKIIGTSRYLCAPSRTPIRLLIWDGCYSKSTIAPTTLIDLTILSYFSKNFSLKSGTTLFRAASLPKITSDGRERQASGQVVRFRVRQGRWAAANGHRQSGGLAERSLHRTPH